MTYLKCKACDIEAGLDMVARERTARWRASLSRPALLALQSGLMPQGASIFDFGCGLGGDVEGFRKLGFPANGWDPAYRAHTGVSRADVVNLGYVINVIENLEERVEVLLRA